MRQEEIYEALNAIFRNVLDDEDITLTPATTARDIEQWDSLSHVELVVEIEHQFHIKFTSLEIMSWQNVGQMVESIVRHLQ